MAKRSVIIFTCDHHDGETTKGKPNERLTEKNTKTIGVVGLYKTQGKKQEKFDLCIPCFEQLYKFLNPAPVPEKETK